MSQIVPLHVHTHFSSLGGPGSPREWCARAAALGYEALGVADRGPLVAHLELAAAAREAGIKPLFGMEVDLLLALPPADEPKGKKKSEGGSQKSEVVQPILLFARDGEGLDNLAALASVAYKGWPRREQAITWEAVASRAGGLLAVLLAAD